jgi:hypothetical protein
MERMTYAQAVGEAPIGSPAFVAGVDFDPGDPEELEVVRLASSRHGIERIEGLERQVADLKDQLARERGYDEYGEEY